MLSGDLHRGNIRHIRILEIDELYNGRIMHNGWRFLQWLR